MQEKSKETKSKILSCVQSYLMKGGIGKVPSMRTISKETGVALGLINYHFGSRDTLIRMAVRDFISDLIQQDSTAQDGLLNDPGTPLHFLFAYSGISRASILLDLEQPDPQDNTAITRKIWEGLYHQQPELELKTWILAGFLHEIFFRKEEFEKQFDFDLDDPTDRDKVMQLIEKLLDLRR